MVKGKEQPVDGIETGQRSSSPKDIVKVQEIDLVAGNGSEEKNAIEL